MLLMPLWMTKRRPDRVRVVAVGVALVLGSGALGVGSVAARSRATSSNSDRQSELLDAIGEASSAEVQALRELTGARERVVLAEAELARLDAELVIAERQVVDAEAAADDAAARYYELYYRVEDGKAVVRSARDDARATALELYMSGGKSSLVSLDTLFSSDHRDLAVRDTYLGVVSDARTDRLESAYETLGALETLTERAEALREAADEAVELAEARRAQVATLREHQADLRSDLARAEADEARVLEQIRAAKDFYETELARLVAESGSIADMLRVRQQGQPRSPLVIARPVPGPVVSPFGPRIHPILGYERMHLGVDMDGQSGDPIHAAADGVVVWADSRGGYGNCVIIEHGNQFATLYAHQSSFAVSIGDTVAMGQTIGFVGSTGLSTGPHLHFEVRDLGLPVDPAPYL
jgi:murein DD-endopeptidase MepM/ murein hydrolase activator NlpD